MATGLACTIVKRVEDVKVDRCTRSTEHETRLDLVSIVLKLSDLSIHWHHDWPPIGVVSYYSKVPPLARNTVQRIQGL